MLAADRFVRSGKVRDLYTLDAERLLLVASDRLSAFDVVLPTADPGQGPGADRAVAVLVRRDGVDHPEPPARHRPERRRGDRPGRRASRTVDGVPAGERCAGRSRGPWLPCGVGLEGIPRDGHRVRRGAPSGTPRERPPARADLHARRPRRRAAPTTSTSRSTTWSTTSPRSLAAGGGRGPGCRGDPRSGPAVVPLRFGCRGTGRDPARGHEVRVRVRPGRHRRRIAR